MESFSMTIKRRRLGEKLCYVLSAASVCLLTYGVTSAPYIIPYIFTVMMSLLFLNEYLILNGFIALLNMCYIGNAITLVFIWFMPQNIHLFSVIFVISNGPIMLAMVVFGNSLVFHSFKNMHYVYMHILPALLSSLIRWYPKETSKFWNQEFIPHFMETSYTWLFGVSLGFIILHRVVQFGVEQVFKPGKDLFSIIKQQPGILFHFLNIFGPKNMWTMFLLTDAAMSTSFIVMSILMYHSFIFNCIVTVVVLLTVTYNGAFFYLEVFSRKDRERYLLYINGDKDKQGQ